MTGYGTRPAPRTCPYCGDGWTQLVDRADRQTARTAACPRCRQPAAPHRQPAPPQLRVPRGDWVQQADCASTDPELFFPDKGHTATAAKTICAGCPVISECLAWAVTTREPHGIWGGHTPTERRHLQPGRVA